MKRTIHSTAILLLLTLSSLLAQERESNCTTDSLIISTGWDRATDTSEVWRDADAYWRVIRIDVNPKPTSIETGQAAIVPYQCMIPLGESRWINGSSELLETADGTWTYQTIVCADEIPVKASLRCDLLASTETAIFFNGIELARTGQNGADHRLPFHVEADLTPYIKAGENLLTVEVTGFDQSFVGFDLLGSITARSQGEKKTFSCDRCGQVIPRER
ncbi:MAG: hypothetical protein AB7H80_02370 [Candidatus Kapaibacterium sp.]